MELVIAVESKIMEKIYSLSFNEEQILDLHQLLDSLLEEDMDMIDNPKTEDEISVGREIRLECANKTMDLFHIVDKQVQKLAQENSNG